MNFSYSAITKDGRREMGCLEARSKDEAMRQLVHDSKTVVELKEAIASKNGKARLKRTSRIFANQKADLSSLFDNLSLLTGVGFSLPQALQSMKFTADNETEKAVVEAIAGELNAGRPANLAFASAGQFAPHILAMIESGDKAQSLPLVFSEISKSIEEEKKTRSAVWNALAYPGFLILLMAVALGIITFGLVPAIEPVFSNSGKANPTVIDAFVSFRWFLANAWPWAVLSMAVCLGAMLIKTFRKQVFAAIHAVYSQLPIFGNIIMANRLARYLASLGMLLEHHAPMTQSLKAAAGSVSNALLQKKLLGIADDLAAGTKLPQAIEKTQLFDGRTVALVAIGFEAGKLPNALKKSAELVKVANRRRIERMVSVLTPALTIFMGLVIGGLVVSVMTALLAINDLALQ